MPCKDCYALSRIRSRGCLSKAFVIVSLSHPDFKTGKVGETLFVFVGREDEVVVCGSNNLDKVK